MNGLKTLPLGCNSKEVKLKMNATMDWGNGDNNDDDFKVETMLSDKKHTLMSYTDIGRKTWNCEKIVISPICLMF